MNKIDALLLEMTAYEAGCPARIQHFFKVHAFSRLIGVQEGLDARTLFTLEAAACVHDIGIRAAHAKYGRSDGKLQEQEGPALAQAMLAQLGFDADVTARAAYLVGHHHTYTEMDGLDYRILVEADFLVNLFESEADADAVKSAYDHIFRTGAGRRLCREMFGLDAAE